MRIEKVKVEGFRLLQDVEIMLEDSSTVVVGRNNSGKTSLTDIFDRFIGQSELASGWRTSPQLHGQNSSKQKSKGKWSKT